MQGNKFFVGTRRPKLRKMRKRNPNSVLGSTLQIKIKKIEARKKIFSSKWHIIPIKIRWRLSSKHIQKTRTNRAMFPFFSGQYECEEFLAKRHIAGMMFLQQKSAMLSLFGYLKNSCLKIIINNPFFLTLKRMYLRNECVSGHASSHPCAAHLPPFSGLRHCGARGGGGGGGGSALTPPMGALLGMPTAK